MQTTPPAPPTGPVAWSWPRPARHRRVRAALAVAIVALAVVLAAAPASARPAAASATPFDAVVLGVGDRASTLRVARTAPRPRSDSGLSSLAPDELVDLSQCVSPSTRQLGGAAAAQLALDELLGERVRVRVVGPGPDVGSQAAAVTHGRRSLCHTLVAAGAAWVLPAARSDAALARLEREAREARRGLWAHPDPIPPWQWRDLMLLRDPAHQRFHSDWDCPWVRATQCEGCSGRFWSLEEATAAGFTPHDACMTPENLRLAANAAPMADAQALAQPPQLPPHARRQCSADADCVAAPFPACTCRPCATHWLQPVRADVARRMSANFRAAACGPVPCPACANPAPLGVPRCVAGQCAAVAPRAGPEAPGGDGSLPRLP